MNNEDEKRRFLASHALSSLAPSIRESLLSDPQFLEEYGFETECDITFGPNAPTIRKSTFFQVLEDAFANPDAGKEISAKDKTQWIIRVETLANGSISLNQDNRRLLLPPLWPHLPKLEQRLTALDSECQRVNLPPEAKEKWRQKITESYPSTTWADQVLEDINNTPVAFSQNLATKLEQGVTTTNLVPNPEVYYERLVGCTSDIEHYDQLATDILPQHYKQLLAWNPTDGLLYALLLSSHASLLKNLNLEDIGATATLEAFQNLADSNDYVSQTGAIEIGLAKLKDWPELATPIESMINALCLDDATSDASQYRLLSHLIVLADSQISSSELFVSSPPSIRRIASIAHAALLKRDLCELQIDIPGFCKQGLRSAFQYFAFKNLMDMRQEPRWHPQWVDPEQLKQELLSRVYQAAKENEEILAAHEQLNGRTLNKQAPDSLINQLLPLPAWLPGPLEGKSDIAPPCPEMLVGEIKKKLSESPVAQDSFTPLINAARLFDVDKNVQNEIVAKLRNSSRHQLISKDNHIDDSNFLNDLAMVAANTRNTEIADEVRILARRHRITATEQIPLPQEFQVLLTAAAANEDVDSWCKFLSGWVTALAFDDINGTDAHHIHSLICQLCDIDPALWHYLGRADAAVCSLFFVS